MTRKANFRAWREMLGLTQANVAGLLSVDVRSVKRWENPEATGYNVPERAFELLGELQERFMADVSSMLAAYMANNDGTGVATIAIYRDAEYLAERGGVGIPYGMVNAEAYEVARILEDDDVTVEFYYAGYEGGIVDELANCNNEDKGRKVSNDELVEGLYYVSLVATVEDKDSPRSESTITTTWEFDEREEAHEFYDEVDLNKIFDDEGLRKEAAIVEVDKELFTCTGGKKYPLLCDYVR